MELVAYFEQFLKDEVNLNQNRIDKLDQKKISLTNFIKDSDEFKELFKKMDIQGSYAQKTIIKPADTNQEFDADFLLLLKESENWEAKDYINELYNIFKNNGSYENIVSRNKRCVIINYAGDFHIDIVPCIVKNSEYFICNRVNNEFELDKPIEFKEWFFNKHKDSHYQLIKPVRLFKYMRDIKTNYSVKSILLNTLLGNEIGKYEIAGDFKNITTAFYTLFKRLNEFLQQNTVMPIINNPVLIDEDLTTRNWNQVNYENFRNKVNLYFEKTEEAYNENDKQKSIEKWQKVFGDKFPNSLQENKVNNTLKSVALVAPKAYASKF